MEKVITIICNIILFLILIFNINNYADFVLGICLLFLICLYAFYLVSYIRKYIDKNTRKFEVPCIFL